MRPKLQRLIPHVKVNRQLLELRYSLHGEPSTRIELIKVASNVEVIHTVFDTKLKFVTKGCVERYLVILVVLYRFIVTGSRTVIVCLWRMLHHFDVGRRCHVRIPRRRPRPHHSTSAERRLGSERDE
jgi:hypothetical protein